MKMNVPILLLDDKVKKTKKIAFEELGIGEYISDALPLTLYIDPTSTYNNYEEGARGTQSAPFKNLTTLLECLDFFSIEKDITIISTGDYTIEDKPIFIKNSRIEISNLKCKFNFSPYDYLYNINENNGFCFNVVNSECKLLECDFNLNYQIDQHMEEESILNFENCNLHIENLNIKNENTTYYMNNALRIVNTSALLENINILSIDDSSINSSCKIGILIKDNSIIRKLYSTLFNRIFAKEHGIKILRSTVESAIDDSNFVCGISNTLITNDTTIKSSSSNNQSISTPISNIIYEYKNGLDIDRNNNNKITLSNITIDETKNNIFMFIDGLFYTKEYGFTYIQGENAISLDDSITRNLDLDDQIIIIQFV